ncbi:MAG: hypothetical protein KDL87_14180, partial [Verrucomicrobiae bacterium]|nr:hypothetical protein [Verrucomicrobiae bacterium]
MRRPRRTGAQQSTPGILLGLVIVVGSLGDDARAQTAPTSPPGLRTEITEQKGLIANSDEDTFQRSREASPVRIEPDYGIVPANHLKFYLTFAQPMERGDVFRFLRLVRIDPDGKEIAEVPDPFREVELWDETFTRMTLWFHPGRQKP